MDAGPTLVRRDGLGRRPPGASENARRCRSPLPAFLGRHSRKPPGYISFRLGGGEAQEKEGKGA
eukprot:13429123-Heterocapsa_arctica.AAC.1